MFFRLSLVILLTASLMAIVSAEGMTKGNLPQAKAGANTRTLQQGSREGRVVRHSTVGLSQIWKVRVHAALSLFATAVIKPKTEIRTYTFRYANSEVVLPLIRAQLKSEKWPRVTWPKLDMQTITYEEVTSNLSNIQQFIADLDKPVNQVMIEARLIQIRTDSLQNFKIDWKRNDSGKDYRNTHAIQSPPQLSVVLRALNEDAHVEFLANPRLVTGDREKANIKLSKKSVPEIDFNDPNPKPIFGSFADNEIVNTLSVTPEISSTEDITLQIQPIPGRKQAGQTDPLPAHLPPALKHTLQKGETLVLVGWFDEPDPQHTILVLLTPTLLKPFKKSADGDPNSKDLDITERKADRSPDFGHWRQWLLRGKYK